MDQTEIVIISIAAFLINIFVLYQIIISATKARILVKHAEAQTAFLQLIAQQHGVSEDKIHGIVQKLNEKFSHDLPVTTKEMLGLDPEKQSKPYQF